MIWPTKLGVALLMGAWAMYLVSLQSRLGLLLLVVGLLLACFVLNAFAARRAAGSLVVEPPPAIAAAEGETLRGSWQVRNLGRISAGLATVSSPWGPLFRVGAIPPRETVHLTPDLRLPSRGVFPLRRLRIRSSYPFGLFTCQRQVASHEEILVYPRVYPCDAPLAAGYEPMVGGRFTGRHRGSSGDQFHGVRPMQDGDPLKLIHWPSSSKGQGLMVREFDEELSGRVTLVVDCSEGRAPNGEPYLNWVARAAASLMNAALDAGHQVEVALLGRGPVLSVPPFADGEVVLAALARAVPRRDSLSRAHLTAAFDQAPRKSALVYVLTRPAAEWLEHLDAEVLPAHRKCAVYLPAPCREEAESLPFPTRFFGAAALEED